MVELMYRGPSINFQEERAHEIEIIVVSHSLHFRTNCFPTQKEGDALTSHTEEIYSKECHSDLYF